MEPVIDWIRPNAISALVAFLRLKGQAKPGEVEWEDNRSNIRFRGPPLKPVQVVRVS
jgi:hypothetical protein